MIQRMIYTVLQQGLAAIQANPGLLDDLFAQNFELGAVEVAGIKQYFATHQPTLTQNYAHADATMPLYAIVLQGEQMTDMYLGDDAGQTNDPTAPGGRQVGAIWEGNYHVLCYAEHPDVVTYMYEVAKSAMLANHNYFIQNDVVDTVLSGMDLAPDPRYLPEHLFCRVLAFRCKREFATFDPSSTAGLAFAVSGVANQTGSPIDPGNVLQGVDPTLGETP